VLLASVAVAEGDLGRASEWLGRAIEVMPGDDATRFRRMLIDLQRGAAAEAAAGGLDLMERDGRCPGVLQATGQALVAEGRAEEAVEPLQRLVAIQPDNAEARSLLGAALLILRRTDDAVEALRQAVALDPTPSRLANVGLALSMAGRGDEAIATLMEGVRDHPDHAGLWNNLGIALASAGRLSEARDALRRALEIDPDARDARANLADVEALLGGSNAPPAEPPSRP